MESLIGKTDLPQQFGVVVLLFSLVLFLAPWMSGVDFGFLKVPAFSERARRVLRVVGPIVLIFAILIHVPFLAVASAPGQATAPPSDTTELLQGPEDVPASAAAPALHDRDLRELVLAFSELIPKEVETRSGLQQYWHTLTDECTLVLRDRKFDPVSVKETSLSTYTIDFANVVTAEATTHRGLPGVSLRFFEGRGAELRRYTVEPERPDPIRSERRSALVVEIIVSSSDEAVAYANEIATRCAGR